MACCVQHKVPLPAAQFTLYFDLIDQTNLLGQRLFVVVLQAFCLPLPTETRGCAAGQAVLRLL